MTSNAIRHPYMQMQFNEPMLHPTDVQHPPNISNPNSGFIQPGNVFMQDSQQLKPPHPANPVPNNTIPMSTLIDFVVYKTYHDITVMSDILPSKNDMERKTTIVEFSTRTRQLFVRLLSLVKWASSVGKVVRCSDISNFLDRQAMMFVDAADKLHILANQLVVQARLPNFSIPAAVDVLTTGTYPRLPLCIRDRIIPPDPIKPKEKKATLKRINQIMLYRLVTEYIPPQIVDVKVDQGVVLLHVPHEFEVYITLMGDGADIPWRVLKLEFLVEDLDIGSGRSLVHPMQVNYIHQLVQSRLFANEKPLQDMFDLLHSFCLSLQLEVLHAQAGRLARLRWGKFIHVEEYLPGQKLSVSYWRINSYKKQTQPCIVTIQQSPDDPSRPLQVKHTPPLESTGGLNLVKSSSHVNDLSLEHLIHHSISARSYHVLTQIKEMLYKHIRWLLELLLETLRLWHGDLESVLGSIQIRPIVNNVHDASYFSCDDDDQRAVLFIPLLDGWTQSECLRLLIDPQTGQLSPSLDGVSDTLLDKMEREINESQNLILHWFHTLRAFLAKLRCKRTLQHLPVHCQDQLLLQKSTDFDETCIFVKFLRHPSYYLAVKIVPVPQRPTVMTYEYHLVATSLGGGLGGRKPGEHNPGSALLGVKSIHKLDPSLSSKPIHTAEEAPQHEALNSQLIHVVSTCNARIPFISLVDGLDERGIDHQGVQEEGAGLGLVCNLLSLPKIPELSNDINALLQDSVAQCSFRVNDRGHGKTWSVELFMKEVPIQGHMDKHSRDSALVSFSYDAFTFTHTIARKEVLKLFINDWTAIGNLYSSVLVFSHHYLHSSYALSNRVRVHSYNYKSITIQYGKDLSLTVTITWTPEKKFFLRFGRCGKNYSNNAHCLVKHYLSERFNSNPDINDLMQILTDTSAPLQALSRLPHIPLCGVQVQKSIASVDVLFTIVPQNPTRFRVYFLSTYCIDIYCREDGRVMIRDGSFSQFDFAKTKSSLIPIPGLAAFLSKHKDPAETRRFADAEKDNPPSPKVAQGVPQSGALHALPPAAYSGASFTVLQHSALQFLCTPCPSLINQQSFRNQPMSCPLEQFLSVALSRRYLNKCTATTESVQLITLSQSADGADASLASSFSTTSLQLVCQPHPQDMRRLVMKVAAIKQNMENWMNQDLQILEKFFEFRVTCAPYRFNAMKSFFNIITAPTAILKDLIQLMRLEMYAPNMPGFNPKSSMSLCLTSPPTQGIAQVGGACVMIKDKVLIFIQLTPFIYQGTQGHPVVSVPLLYEPSKKSVSVLTIAMQQNSTWSQELLFIHNLLLRLGDVNRSENSIAYAVRYLMEAYAGLGMP